MSDQRPDEHRDDQPAQLGYGSDPDEPKYGDLLLVDILKPDWRNFFSRYRTDLIGLAIVSLIVVFIIVMTRYIAMIGADAPVGS